jgi:hypothetical protein
MSIPASCPYCATSYNLNEAVWGKTVRCRECQRAFAVGPRRERNEEVFAAEAPTRGAAARGVAAEDIEPRRRRRSRSRADNTVTKVILIVGSLVALVILLSCGSYYLFIWRVTKTASDFANNFTEAFAPPRDVSQAIAYLKSGDTFRRHNALQWLARTPLDEKRRVEVARAVEPFLEDRDGSLHAAAANVLVTWGVSENVPVLLRALDDDGPGHAEVIQALGAIKDARAAGPLARRLSNFFDRGHASKALRALGSVAEPEVVKCLQHRDFGVRTEACKILKYIGTPQSVPALQEAARDSAPGVSDEAQAALDEIARRQ